MVLLDRRGTEPRNVPGVRAAIGAFSIAALGLVLVFMSGPSAQLGAIVTGLGVVLLLAVALRNAQD